MKTVHIVGYDSVTSGGFDWYPNLEAATQQFLTAKKDALSNPWQEQVFFKSLEVEEGLTNDEITDLIDSQLSDIENATATESFPYTREEWLAIMTEEYS